MSETQIGPPDRSRVVQVSKNAKTILLYYGSYTVTSTTELSDRQRRNVLCVGRSFQLLTLLTILTLGMHAQEGYGTCLVCVCLSVGIHIQSIWDCVCVYIYLSVV